MFFTQQTNYLFDMVIYFREVDVLIVKIRIKKPNKVQTSHTIGTLNIDFFFFTQLKSNQVDLCFTLMG